MPSVWLRGIARTSALLTKEYPDCSSIHNALECGDFTMPRSRGREAGFLLISRFGKFFRLRSWFWVRQICAYGRLIGKNGVKCRSTDAENLCGSLLIPAESE